nr:MAG TPA: hypothetical protein [Caudoviricetes sp.]DAV67091.1 MAG TPA: hypothetical protein [Caudoviricetes sp.]
MNNLQILIFEKFHELYQNLIAFLFLKFFSVHPCLDEVKFLLFLHILKHFLLQFLIRYRYHFRHLLGIQVIRF